MLDAIIAFSLRNRLIVVAAAALILAWGSVLITRLPVDVLPNLNRPTVTIFLEAEGLAPEEVETQVAFPVETMMNGATGVRRVRSVSSVGLALVFIEFDWDMDIYRARQIVSEKLNSAREQLPVGVNPVMGPISSIMGEIMLIAITADANQNLTSMDLRTLADWTVRPRLLSVAGIAQVTVIGGDVRQFQVLVRQERLKALGLTLHDVEAALKESNVNTGGAFVFEGAAESMVRNIARVESIEDLEQTVIVDRGGVPVLLSHVAEVREGSPIKRGEAGANGRRAVILSIQKQPDADTVALSAQINLALDGIEKGLKPGYRVHREIFRQSEFIRTAIHNVLEALRDGAIFVALVLLLFLLNFRTTLITLTAIPLSLVITAFVFHLFGMSINTMTLGGLAIAIGELVDDAIVDIENVFRRLKEWKKRAESGAADAPSSHGLQGAALVIFRASSEVRGSIVFATVIVVLVFVPLFSMGGIEGRIFVPLGVAYVVSILASLVVALTLTPALASYLLPRAKFMDDERDGWLVRCIKHLDEHWVLRTTLRYPGASLAVGPALVVLSLWSASRFGSEFLPPFNEGSVTINLLLPPGTALAETDRVGRLAEDLIREVPEVRQTGRRVGRAEQDDHAEGVHSTEIEVELDVPEAKGIFSRLTGFFRSSRQGAPARSREAVLADIRGRLGMLPGLVVNIGQPISHRIDHLLSGVRAQIAVKLFADDLEVLRAKADEIRRVMGEVPGVVDLYVEKQVLVPETLVRIDRRKAQLYGLRVGEVAEVVETALQGLRVGEILDGQRRYDIVLRLPDEARRDAGALGETLIDTPGHGLIPLRAVAEVIDGQGPNQVLREDTKRRIVIQCNTSGRDLGGVVEDIRQRLGQHVVLPEGSFITFGGQYESQQQARRTLAFLSLFSLAGIIIALYSHFRSANLVVQILASIPFSFVGAIAGIYLTGGVVSVASMVAFITLCGIDSRNGIMMISHYLHLLRHEGESWNQRMIVRGALERIVPVLMTALTASLSLIPLILAAGETGKEILHPVAVVVFSGIIGSTLMDIALRPAMFWLFGRRAVEHIFRELCPEELPRVFAAYGATGS